MTPEDLEESILVEAAIVLNIAVDTLDEQFLDDCRQIYPKSILVKAAKRLDISKYERLSAWIQQKNATPPKQMEIPINIQQRHQSRWIGSL